MPWYRTGTVAITAGQTTVTGTGTNFSANSRVGDAFQGPDGRWYEVTNIASGTVLSILPAYQGATVSGGTYGLAPMQGYVKESADRLRQIVDQWGSTLAGLGSVSVENVVPVAKGGTGGTTQAGGRSGLGLKAAAVADILGTVSQSGGVPTGAIYERGSNANGEYVKFADGTMICSGLKDLGTQTFSAVGGVFYTGPFNPISFPATFVGIPKVNIGVISSIGLAWASQGSAFASTTASAGFFVLNTSAASNSLTAVYIAVGRWFP